MVPVRTIFRVEKTIYAGEAKKGDGARLYGGRWNSPGRPVVYCGESLALSILEILVHAATIEERADPRVWFSINLSLASFRKVAVSSLPKGWSGIDVHPATVALGDAWLAAGTTPVLQVPSAVVPGAWNYLINAAHPKTRKMVRWSKPRNLELDGRLVDGVPRRP